MPKSSIRFKLRRRFIPDEQALSSSERQWIAQAAGEMIARLPRRERLDRAEIILDFLQRYAPALKIEVTAPDFDSGDNEAMLAALAEVSERLSRAAPGRQITSLEKRLAWAGRLIGLPPIDLVIAETVVRHRLSPAISQMNEAILDQHRSYLSARAIAASNALATQAVVARLAPSMPLRLSGLIEDQGDDDCCASPFLLQLAKMRTIDPKKLADAMLPPDRASALSWSDFAHIAPEADLAHRLVQTAARKRTGINILLHGPAGTGKTEFARAIADRCGLSGIFIGTQTREGEEPSRGSRLAHLNMVRALTRRSTGHLIVIDEAEDVMISADSEMRHHFSKLWLNRTVEASTGPTIWIVNDLEALGAPIIRRMDMAIAFRLPPDRVRAQLLGRHAEVQGVSLTLAEQEALGCLKVPPAVSSAAVRVAGMTGGGSESVERVARGLGAALGRTFPPLREREAIFDPSLSCADQDLTALAGQLQRSQDRRWSLLLYGASGTGKSAYARHLARLLDVELMVKRGSDLLGPYVGETEQRIAEAFSRAAARNAMLLIDEGDALLRDRQRADKVWEVSMVNEWLSWMEQHPAPLIVTTNLADMLDTATQRRFLLRVRFDPVDTERAKMLWQRHFFSEPPAGLANAGPLTPADFAVVARRSRLTGKNSASGLVSMLAAEAEYRANKTGHRIGFG
ncbi:AAA family ATPase [Sphingomonas sp. YL-JM2C]